MKGPFFIDSNIPMYAAGQASPFKEPCVELLKRGASGEIDLITDVEVFKEILHRYVSIQRRREGLALFELFQTLIPAVLPIDLKDLQHAKALVEQFEEITARDAIHAAIMDRYKIPTLFSYDRHFDRLPFLKRLEPEKPSAPKRLK